MLKEYLHIISSWLLYKFEENENELQSRRFAIHSMACRTVIALSYNTQTAHISHHQKKTSLKG
jgi:hypothetical protein